MMSDEDFLFPEPQITNRMICFPIAEESLRKAAPELLAACELAFKACRTNLTYASFKDEHSLSKAHDACKAAIEKAKGE